MLQRHAHNLKKPTPHLTLFLAQPWKHVILPGRVGFLTVRQCGRHASHRQYQAHKDTQRTLCDLKKNSCLGQARHQTYLPTSACDQQNKLYSTVLCKCNSPKSWDPQPRTPGCSPKSRDITYHLPWVAVRGSNLLLRIV